MELVVPDHIVENDIFNVSCASRSPTDTITSNSEEA